MTDPLELRAGLAKNAGWTTPILPTTVSAHEAAAGTRLAAELTATRAPLGTLPPCRHVVAAVPLHTAVESAALLAVLGPLAAPQQQDEERSPASASLPTPTFASPHWLPLSAQPAAVFSTPTSAGASVMPVSSLPASSSTCQMGGAGDGDGAQAFCSSCSVGSVHHNTFDNTWSELVPLPIDLLEGDSIDREATALLLHQKIPGLLDVTFVNVCQSEVHIKLTVREAQDVRVAAGILQLYLSHQKELSKRKHLTELAVADLHTAEMEINGGLRVGFHISSDLISLLLREDGAYLKRVQDMTGVDRISVSTEAVPSLVHVRGSTPESVIEARRLLEYISCEIELTAEQATWLRRQEGAIITDFCAKSKVVRFDIDEVLPVPRGANAQGCTHRLMLVGLKSDVALAEVLVDLEMSYHLEYRALAKSEEDARTKLRTLDQACTLMLPLGGDGGSRVYESNQNDLTSSHAAGTYSPGGELERTRSRICL